MQRYNGTMHDVGFFSCSMQWANPLPLNLSSNLLSGLGLTLQGQLPKMDPSRNKIWRVDLKRDKRKTSTPFQQHFEHRGVWTENMIERRKSCQECWPLLSGRNAMHLLQAAWFLGGFSSQLLQQAASLQPWTASNQASSKGSNENRHPMHGCKSSRTSHTHNKQI